MFARQHDLTVALRSGGHSMVGHSVSDGGLVIDLSPLKGIWIDPSTRIAQAQAGLTLGEFVQATQTFGLVTTTGTVSSTGLAGLTMGGGIGWLMGKYGLTIDNLLSADLVTAHGDVLTANAHEHPDLFWAFLSSPSVSVTVEILRQESACSNHSERLVPHLPT